jgi:NADPH-dependent 2,4-dienoyl-CoA reductase/sulfur reductase-like enzyme
VVGASLAGLSAARALRAQGYDGELVVVGEEARRPYDRPPLSKEFLTGVDAADLALEASDEDLGITWRLGTRAVTLSAGPVVTLADGELLACDGVVVATGASARRDVRGSDLPGVHVLRTLDDAFALRASLRRGGPVVVVGGGFIGSEVASTARELCRDVTLLVGEDAPLRNALGTHADVITELHRERGVTLVAGARVTQIVQVATGLEVRLADGTAHRASTVVLGIGARPAVEWLVDSGVTLGDGVLGDGVLCDDRGATTLPGVVAVGDCAAWYDPSLGRHHRVEHWTGAREQAPVAAATLLSGGTAPFRPLRPPYVWSELHGRRIQLAGHRDLADSVTVEAGSLEECSFLVVYRRDGEPVAALAVDQPQKFISVRRRLVQVPAHPSVEGALS